MVAAPQGCHRSAPLAFGALALIAPQAAKAGGGAELKNSCALRTSNEQCLVISLLGGRSIAHGI